MSLLIYPSAVLYYVKSVSLCRSLSPDVTKLWQRCRTLSCSQKWFVQRQKGAISLSPAYFPVNKILLMGSKHCEDALYHLICSLTYLRKKCTQKNCAEIIPHPHHQAFPLEKGPQGTALIISLVKIITIPRFSDLLYGNMWGKWKSNW